MSSHEDLDLAMPEQHLYCCDNLRQIEQTLEQLAKVDCSFEFLDEVGNQIHNILMRCKFEATLLGASIATDAKP
jgi:hypothetical protein